MPSIWAEPFGKVGIEAMSVGRVVVASDVGGVSEWLEDGKTGYLIQPESSEEIAEKIIKLLKHEDLLKKMSVNAAERAKDFTIEKHASEIMEVYKSVIKLLEV